MRIELQTGRDSQGVDENPHNSEEEHQQLSSEEQELAELGTRAHFEERARRVRTHLESRKEDVVTLLRRVRGGEQISLEQMRQELELTEEEPGSIHIVAEVYKHMRTLDEHSVATDEDASRKFFELLGEGLDPVAHTQSEMVLLKRGEGWHHTTPEGRATLAKIHEQAHGHHQESVPEPQDVSQESVE